MTVFSAAIDAIYGDSNMAVDAVWRACSGGVDTPCRIILSRPDAMGGFGDAQIVSDTFRFDVRVSDWPAPQSGDMLTLGDETFVVQGEPRRDRMRLIWKCEAVPG